MYLTRAVTEFGRVMTAAEHPHQVLRGRLASALAMTAVVDVVGTVIAYLAERHARGTGISNVGDALFWTTTQLTTVSSQMANPLTTAGRVLDVVLEVYAIVVITSLAGTFASFFTHRERDKRRRDGVEPDYPGS